MDLVSPPTCRGKHTVHLRLLSVFRRETWEESRLQETLKLLKEAAWFPVDRLVKGLVGL